MFRRVMAGFWKKAMLAAFRRWAAAETGPLTGVPFVREFTDPCIAYAPRPAQGRDWKDCVTDGHPLCERCAHKDTRPESDREDER